MTTQITTADELRGVPVGTPLLDSTGLVCQIIDRGGRRAIKLADTTWDLNVIAARRIVDAFGPFTTLGEVGVTIEAVAPSDPLVLLDDLEQAWTAPDGDAAKIAHAPLLAAALREVLAQARSAERIQDEWGSMGNSTVSVAAVRETIANHLTPGYSGLAANRS